MELLTVAEQADEAMAKTAPAVSMFERLAMDPTVSVEKLEKLIDMQERIMRLNAEAAYNAAFSVMQPEIPVIVERGRTDKGSFAELEDIVEVVRPILARHGFSLNHKTEWPEAGKVRIVAVLRHRGGHHDTSEFIGGADTSGSKNAIQALASTISYGRRYTTNDVLCIVTRGQDRDGALPKDAPTAPDGYSNWLDDLRAVASEGSKALSATWASSKESFRDYAQKHDRASVQAIKIAASKAGAK